MMPARSKRMTVAHLKERMDARFNAVDRRMNAMNKKLDEHLATIKLLLKHHGQVVDEHDERLKELEIWRQTRG